MSSSGPPRPPPTTSAADPASVACSSSSSSSGSSPSPSPPTPSSAASQSPPRKRPRRASGGSAANPSSSSTSAAMIADGGGANSNNSPSPPTNSDQHHLSRTSGVVKDGGGRSSARMKLKHSSQGHQSRRGTRGRGPSPSSAPLGEYEPSAVDDFSDEDDEEENGSSPASSSSAAAATLAGRLLRKVPRRKEQLSATDHEIVRLIGQHLTNIGLRTSAEVLMQEAGCRLDHGTAELFKKHVMRGDWQLAVKTLDDLKNHLEHPTTLVEMKFLLLEQKYLELLAQRNRIEALKVLQAELTPLKHNQVRTHELSSFLMLSKSDDIGRVTRPVRENRELSRSQLLDRLQTFLPPSIMLPPRRLNTLLQQAAEFQADRCIFHKGGGVAGAAAQNSAIGSMECFSAPDLDPSYLSVDHCCPRDDFPCQTIQTLSDHMEEVWYCRFSPDGLKLATGSKDLTVIVWDLDPDTLELTLSRTLEQHSHGISYFAWSPDSTRLAVCGPEDCDEVCLWNVETGLVEGKITHSSDDSLTTVSWSPCGTKIACGGNRGNFYQCDTKGTVQDSWEGVRVQCLAYRKDGKTILAADTHHRIRSYNFEDLSDGCVLTEDHGIMSFSLDESDRYALLNIANQGLHLWDVEEKVLVRKFKGMTQGFYAIYSCFGGAGGPGGEQNFVASGSEDNKVYVYHVRREEPVAVLQGHTRTVNCVAWNPVYPSVLVSASDDGTVRVWGPTEKFRLRRLQERKRLRQQRNGGGGHENGEASSSSASGSSNHLAGGAGNAANANAAAANGVS